MVPPLSGRRRCCLEYLPPSKMGAMALVLGCCIAAATARTPFKHAPLPPLLVELRGTLAGPRRLAGPALRDTLAGFRRQLMMHTVVDASLYAATVRTTTGLEVLCRSVRTCHGSMRSAAPSPQLKTGRSVCALCAGAACSVLSLISLALCTACTLSEAVARLGKLVTAAAAEGASHAATLGGDLGTSGLGIAKVEPKLALSWLIALPPSSEAAPEADTEVVPPSDDPETRDAAG